MPIIFRHIALMIEQGTRICWGDELKGLRLGVSTDKDSYSRMEKPIVLAIFIANNTDSPVGLIESHIMKEYDIQISGPDEKSVPMTPEGLNVTRAARILPPSRSTRS